MSGSPKVTIGLPISDQLATYRAAIRSVFAQSFLDWELIIVADGSPPALVGELEKIQDARVKLVVHEGNAGLPTRLNEIAAAAGAPLLARMDADDVMHPERLGLQRQAFMGHVRYDFVSSKSVVIDESDRVRGMYRDGPHPSSPHGFLRNDAVSHPTVMMRTDWARTNPYDGSLARTEDKDLWLRTSPWSTSMRVDAPLMFYRINSQFDVRKIANQCCWDRKVLKRHAPQLVGRSRTGVLLASSRVRQSLLSLAVRLDVERPLYARKYVELGVSAREALESQFLAATQTGVPGWDSDDA